jgi:serine/threonine-protein kinase
MTKEMTAATFLDLLRTSGLLEPKRVNELSRLPEARADSPTDLARVILQRGWLTRFQLNAAAAGRAESLVVGPYVLIDKLGEGGMGTRYWYG